MLFSLRRARPRLAADRRRRSARPAPEPLEERQLLTTYQGTVSQISWRDPQAEERLFEQDVNNRLASYWEMASLTRTALQVYYAANQFGKGADAQALARQNWVGTGGLVDFSGNMGKIRTARALILAAGVLYDEARRTPEPREGELIKQGNELIKKAAPLVQAAINFFFIAQDRWIQWLRDRGPIVKNGFRGWRLPPGFPLQPAYAEEPKQPFKLGAEQDFVPGRVIQVGGVEVEVDNGGGAPKEAGVEWDKWYKQWIETVAKDVWGPLKQGFASDPNKYQATITYTVYPNGRVVVNGGTTEGSYAGGNNWGLSARNKLLELNYGLNKGKLTTGSSRVPQFPEGTKRTSVTRTFTFSWRWSPGAPEVKLGGPPSG